MKAALKTQRIPCINELLGYRIGYNANDKFAVTRPVPQFFNDNRRQCDVSFAFDGFGALLNNPFPRIVFYHGSANMYQALIQVYVGEL